MSATGGTDLGTALQNVVTAIVSAIASLVQGLATFIQNNATLFAMILGFIALGVIRDKVRQGRVQLYSQLVQEPPVIRPPVGQNQNPLFSPLLNAYKSAYWFAVWLKRSKLTGN